MTTTIDATPVPVDLKVYAGDDLYLTITVTDKATGSPADLSGCTGKAQIRATAEATEVLAELVTTVDPSGVVDVHLDGTDTAVLPPTAVWDVQLTYPGGDVFTLVAGKVRTAEQVTR